jgi:hypothetical protein
MSRSLEELRAQALRNKELAAARQRLLATLRQLDVALAQWYEWAADQQLPPPQRRHLPTPLMQRESLETLREVALARLDELEALGW